MDISLYFVVYLELNIPVIYPVQKYSKNSYLNNQEN